jgi:hypothetical protein
MYAVVDTGWWVMQVDVVVGIGWVMGWMLWWVLGGVLSGCHIDGYWVDAVSMGTGLVL